MKKLENAFNDYLEKVGMFDFVTLGDDNKEISITDEESQYLIKNLKTPLKHNNIIIIIAITMLCILFLAGMMFVFLYRNNPTMIVTIFGGNLLALLSIVMKLRQFWLDKFVIDHATQILNDLPPEEASKVMLNLYSTFIKK